MHKTILKLTGLLFIVINILSCTTQPVSKKPSDYVDPLIGTSNSRWMLFPGPAMPFGMVKYSPDNQKNVWNGGYEYTVASISGFSHIHSWSMGGLSLMPVTGALKVFPGPSDGPFDWAWTSGYRSRIKKETEHAECGYYSVNLYDYNIGVELTTTPRCGFMRLQYPDTSNARLLFNFNFEYEENDPSLIEAYVHQVSAYEIEGHTHQTSSFADDYTVHFVVRFNKPIAEFTPWKLSGEAPYNLYGTQWMRNTEYFNDTAITMDGDCGLFVNFDMQNNEQVMVQSAISLVSIEQARLNMTTELTPYQWDFEKVVYNHKNTWNDLLGSIEIKDNNEKARRQFYTNLYRAYSARTQWNDVNGKYVDMCEKEQELDPENAAIYGSDALWGAHWNLFPLWSLLTPHLANKWVNSLLEMYKHGGWLPQGPSGIEYCEVMTAAHQIKLIVGAYQKGIRNFDTSLAYEAIIKSQTVPGIKHPCGGWAGNKNLDSYLKYGYVANEDGPVSNTLEIAFDDWAVAQFAKALGKTKDYKTFMERSENFKNIFDPETRFMRQKHKDGRWVQDWDSLENHGTWFGAGYVEGTAWHYSFFVPHNYPELINMVGKKHFIDRLEQGFKHDYIDIGNQPNMQAPFIFNYAGAPWLTQKYTHYLLEHDFSADPYRGWPGEEDQGQLGAWYVLATIGLFQVDGGCAVRPYYTLTSPSFEKIIIHLDNKYYSGNELVIESSNFAPENIYIQSVSFNGKTLDGPWIYHDELIQGGTLRFELSDTPNYEFGSDLSSAPFIANK